MFYDDLQFADESSLEVFAFLANDTDSRRVLLIGSYRDDEANPSLLKCMDWLRDETKVASIQTQALDFDSTNAMIAEAIGEPVADTEALTMVVHRKTRGNCFFVLQILGCCRNRATCVIPSQTAGGNMTFKKL